MKKITVFLSLLLVLALSAATIAGCGGSKDDKKQSDEWPTEGLAAMLPKPENGTLDITFDWDDRFMADWENTNKTAYKNYVDACKSKGFTVEAEETNSSVSRYDAYNSEGYKLELMMISEDSFSISIMEPEKLETITWPSVGLATLIPEPESKTGKIERDSSDRFSATIGDTSLEDYKTYAGICYDYGFAFDYDNGDDHYNAYNDAGVYLRVSYEGNNIMSISVEAPEETTAEAETTAPEETQAPETNAPETPAQADSGIIRPEIKEAIDSYEAFIDEYCEFMKNYNASDFTMLAKYAEFLSKEVEMTKQFNDIENEDLNDAETAYFLEVDARCIQKLNEAAASIGN